MKIKGIAIVMMVFLHLFNRDIYTNSITPVFVYNDVPLFAFFVPITTPVLVYLSVHHSFDILGPDKAVGGEIVADSKLWTAGSGLWDYSGYCKIVAKC